VAVIQFINYHLQNDLLRVEWEFKLYYYQSSIQLRLHAQRYILFLKCTNTGKSSKSTSTFTRTMPSGFK